MKGSGAFEFSRGLALVVGVATAVYAMWLMVIGLPVEIATTDSAQSLGRQPALQAVIPLLFSLVFLYGLVRDSRSAAWSGAISILIYGTLSIFGMGIYMPLLGLGMVVALAFHALASRTGSKANPLPSPRTPTPTS